MGHFIFCEKILNRSHSVTIGLLQLLLFLTPFKLFHQFHFQLHLLQMQIFSAILTIFHSIGNTNGRITFLIISHLFVRISLESIEFNPAKLRHSIHFLIKVFLSNYTITDWIHLNYIQFRNPSLRSNVLMEIRRIWFVRWAYTNCSLMNRNVYRKSNHCIHIWLRRYNTVHTAKYFKCDKWL